MKTAGRERPPVGERKLPFETEQLRIELARFLNQAFVIDPASAKHRRLGSVKWGAYAFFDYDGEPIYVGQTSESLGTRIRRHLTNQRSDAVAMKVLDPYEVHTIKVWPLPQFQDRTSKSADAKAVKQHLDALEHAIFQACLAQSTFKVVLNEKDPPKPTMDVAIPALVEGSIVPAAVSRLRDHPDLRIARRASTLARLAQVISERKVNTGLRRALLAQAVRLQDLAARRLAQAPVVEDDELQDDGD